MGLILFTKGLNNEKVSQRKALDLSDKKEHHSSLGFKLELELHTFNYPFASASLENSDQYANHQFSC